MWLTSEYVKKISTPQQYGPSFLDKFFFILNSYSRVKYSHRKFTRLLATYFTINQYFDAILVWPSESWEIFSKSIRI